MTTRDLGHEGFIWFVGVVEDRDDPLKLGRLRVRIYNVHSTKQSRTRTEDLPWASVLTSVTGANFNKIGQAPVGIQVGTTVVGFFMDGYDANNPVIIGALAGRQSEEEHDVPPEARENNTIDRQQVGNEPASSYNAKYPYNKVLRTESGHVVEIDDTPNYERIHVHHKSGSYIEINQDGQTVLKSVDNNYEIVVKDKDVYIGGELNINVKGHANISVDGSTLIKTPQATVDGQVTITGNANVQGSLDVAGTVSASLVSAPAYNG